MVTSERVSENGLGFQFYRIDPYGLKFVIFWGSMSTQIPCSSPYGGWYILLKNAPTGFEPTITMEITINSMEGKFLSVETTLTAGNHFIWLNRGGFTYTSRIQYQLFYL